MGRTATRLFTSLYILSLIGVLIGPVLLDAGIWKHFLPGICVNTAVFDSHNRIYWFGTEGDGLFSFDGWRFQQITMLESAGHLLSDNINALAMDDEFLWIATDKGLARYKPVEQEWDSFTQNTGLVSDQVTALFIGERCIWYGTSGDGIGKFDGADWFYYGTSACYIRVFESGVWTWQELFSYSAVPGLSDIINTISGDQDGNIFIGTHNRGLIVLNQSDTSWTSYAYPDSFSSPQNNRVQAIAVDEGQQKWIGTDFGLIILNGKNHVDTTHIESDRGLVNSDINAIWIDGLNQKFIGTSGGVTILDSSGTRWSRFTLENPGGGPASNTVQAIAGDSDDNVWFGFAEASGVSQLNYKWMSLTKEDGEGLLSNFVNALSRDVKGRLWTGTKSGGVDIFNKSKWTHIPLQYAVTAIATTKSNRVWVGTQGGLFAMTSESTDAFFNMGFPENFPGDEILAMATQKDSVLWIGTEGGLCRLYFDSESQPVCDFFDLGTFDLPNYVQAVVVDRSSAVWVGTFNGLGRFDGQTWTVYKSMQDLPDDDIRALAADSSGAIWIGTAAGVARFRDNTWRAFGTTDGLPGTAITSLATAPNGTVWCGTLTGAASLNKQDSVWTAYTTFDGLGHDFITDITFARQGIVWLSTFGGGLSRYHRTEIAPVTQIVTDIDVITDNSVTFEFTGFDLNTPTTQLRYSYKLDHENWSRPTFTTFVTLAVAQQGRHTFRVKAIDKDNIEARYPAIKSFYRIDPGTGGSTTITDRSGLHGLDSVRVKLYWPPNQLAKTTRLKILPVPLDSLEKPAILAYDFKPFSTPIHPKGAILSFDFPKSSTEPGEQFSVHRDLDFQGKKDGTVLGGTVETENGIIRITTAIQQLGRYVVRKEEKPSRNQSKVEQHPINAQPRIFSPEGGGHGVETTLSFSLPQPAHVRIKVYNLAGRRVNIICDRTLGAGINAIPWNGRDRNGRVCPSGLYIMAVESSVLTATKKVMILKQ